MVKHYPNSIEIGMHSPFGPRFPIEFEAFFQKKLDWPNAHAKSSFLKKGTKVLHNKFFETCGCENFKTLDCLFRQKKVARNDPVASIP